MPPKGKKRTNKVNHSIREVHPQILKRRDADRIKREKQFARCLKRLQKKRTEKTLSTPQASFSESLHHETSDGEIELQDNINLSHSSCSKPGTSHSGEQQLKQGAGNSSVNKKTGKDHASVEETSLIEFQREVSKVPENVTGKTHFRKNVTEPGQCPSKNFPKYSLDDNKLPKNPVQTKAITGNKDSVGKAKEPLKLQQPIKSTECTSASSTNAPPKVRRKISENLIKKKEKLQLKLQVFEYEMKCLDEQKNTISPSVKQTAFKKHKMAVVGDIKILTSNKSCGKNDEKKQTYSYYDANKRTFYIGDEHVKISILVNQGCQIICKSQRCPIVDSDHNQVKSGSRILESRPMVKSDKEIVSDSEHHDQSTTDKKCTSSSVGEFPSKEYQTLETQATVRSDGDIKLDSEQQDESTSSISKLSKENSGLNSIRGNVQKVCDFFLNISTLPVKFLKREL